MSAVALLTAVQSTLRTALGLDSKNVGVQPDGRPPPAAGELYIAIHDGGESSNDDGNYLETRHRWSVTVSRRAGYTPDDREGSDLMLTASTGLLARADAVRAAIHGKTDVLTAANTILGGSVNGFSEVPVYHGRTTPMEVGPEWWRSEKGSGGWQTVLSFSIVRIQTIESQT